MNLPAGLDQILGSTSAQARDLILLITYYITNTWTL